MKSRALFLAILAICLLAGAALTALDRAGPAEPAAKRGEPPQIDYEDLQQPIEADEVALVPEGSYAARRAEAARNRSVNTGLSPEQLRHADYQTYKRFYDPESAAVFAAEMHAVVAAQYGVEEADFYSGVQASLGDWDEVKRLINEREMAVGEPGQYADLLLQVGITTGKITGPELVAIKNQGHAIPPSTAYDLAQTGNIETLTTALAAGTPLDLNYEHPANGRNALSAYADYVGNAYPQPDPEKVRKDVETLLAAGAQVHPTHNALDSLDYALTHVNRQNVDGKVALVKALLETGVPVGDSHRDLVNAIQDDETRHQIESILDNHL